MGANQKIRVCHLISGDLWAGAEAQAFTMLKSLSTCDDLDIQAVILNNGKLYSKLCELGLETHLIDETQHGFFAIRRKLTDLLHDQNIDLVHSHRSKENVLAGMMKKKGFTKKLVQTVHGMGEPFTGLRKIKTSLTSMMNRSYTRRFFDRIHAVSHDIEIRLKKYIGPDRIVTIHNAVDDDFFIARPDISKIRNEFGFDDNDFLIGTAGRMVPVKGYDMFLKTARIVADKNTQAKFLLAGDGPIKADLEKMAKEMGLSGSVKFVGFRDDIIDFLGGLDLFIMTSYHEGIPVVLLEAMALGKPITATAVGGILEVIEDGKSGILAAPSDADKFAAKCLEVIRDRELRSRLGEGAKARIRSDFSSQAQKEKIHDLYHQLM